MKKNKLFNSVADILTGLFTMDVHAEGMVATAVVEADDNSAADKLDYGTREVWSKEIEYKAMPLMMFYQFAEIKTELGVEPGLTINMLTWDNLKLGGALTELTDMKTQALSNSMKQITVQEYGNAVSASELLIRSSFLDVMQNTTTLLGRDYALVLDTELRDCALTGLNRVYASKADGTKVTARKDLDDTCKLKVATIKDCIEILATNNAPMYNGTDWICFVHPHQARDIRDDAAWINTSNYGAPTLPFTGEIGRIDNTRFIQTTLMCNGAAPEDDPGYKAELKKGAGDVGSQNKTNIYQAVIFGEAYYGLAQSLPVELRDNGVEDFGRKRSLAWYSIFGVGKLHDNYGVVIETA